MNLWSKAEKEKDKRAQYKLALLYFKHNNSDTSVYAFKLFKKSAKQGFTDAAYMLACCYHEGVVIRKNYQRAIKWYITAVNDVTYDIWNNPGDIDREEREAFRKFLEDEEFSEKIDEVLDVK